MTVVQKIKEIIEAMPEGFTFLHEGKPGQNLADDTEFPIAYLDFPIQSDDTLPRSGILIAEYTLILLFGMKSELDWTVEQHQTNCVEPMRTAARNFLTRIQNDSLFRTVSKAKRLDVKNLFDVNISGCLLTFTFTVVDANSICV